MRTNIEDNKTLGKSIADKLNQSQGPVVVIWPKGGLSTLDRQGKPCWNPEADKALLNTLRQNFDDSIPLIELDSYINDDKFAKEVVNEFMNLLMLE